MLVSAETQRYGQGNEQQPFFLVSPVDPGCIYCVGVEAWTGVLAVWLDPCTGKPMFGCFLNIQDAMHELDYRLGIFTPLELVMDEGAPDDVATYHEELVLTKARGTK